MTEHGYTGDNCLQRFARIAKTAERGIPFIYFAPVARTRYDELGRASASYRNVNSDMYRGFLRLTEIYSVPVVAASWNTGPDGIPLVLASEPPRKTGIEQLFNLVASLLVNHTDDLLFGRPVLHCAELEDSLHFTRDLAERNNVRESEVRYEGIYFSEIKNTIYDPSDRSVLMPRGYFFKGKAHKLFALMSLDASSIKRCILPDDSEITIEQMLDRYEQDFSQKKWLYYFSGYEWRSEPNVGIVTNIDYVYCRDSNGKTVSDRTQLLCVHWPRVFWNKQSHVRQQLLDDIQNKNSSTLLRGLAEEAVRTTHNTPNLAILPSGNKVFGAWSNRSTVARVFRDLCDLIILNDVVILGNKWAE